MSKFLQVLLRRRRSATTHYNRHRTSPSSISCRSEVTRESILSIEQRSRSFNQLLFTHNNIRLRSRSGWITKHPDKLQYERLSLKPRRTNRVVDRDISHEPCTVGDVPGIYLRIWILLFALSTTSSMTMWTSPFRTLGPPPHVRFKACKGFFCIPRFYDERWSVFIIATDSSVFTRRVTF